MPLQFRFEGAGGGSPWDIHISHFNDTQDDTLIIPFLSLLLIHFTLGVSIGSLLFSFLKSTSYTLREDIQSPQGWRGLTGWGNRLVLYLELEKELTVLIYDNDLRYVGFTRISNPINWLCNLQKENSFSNYLLFQGL